MDYTGPLTGKQDDLIHKPVPSCWFTALLGLERDKRTIGHLKHSLHHYEVISVELFTNFTFKPGLLHSNTLKYSLCRLPGPKISLQLIKT